ncbi:hypothetical protein EB796_019357 [Bugula neritina]|uniref:Carboxylesterase type B domain-containing protein n=1 Tax=Bugula neritina TaxID=10212 RepID=A0A7J7J7X8_BUGNE|nr:hypothetical protein EB796_019357 [Bugula neritina]
MMTMWTNFAKSGNPNQPLALPADVPEWPQFITETNKFLDLNKDNISVITTPHKERLEKVQSVLFEARRLQVLADEAPVECGTTSEGSGGDSVNEDNSATTLVLSNFLFLLTVLLVSKHPLFF